MDFFTIIASVPPTGTVPRPDALDIVRERVAKGLDFRKKRMRGARRPTRDRTKLWNQLTAEAQDAMRPGWAEGKLWPLHTMMVARTIADLEQSLPITESHVIEARALTRAPLPT